MHELLKHVLNERDLTRAGDLFALQDADIVNDLNEVLKQITEISSRPDYVRNDRDQALIEICVTRVTSCIKETGTLDKYAGALVSLLESCLHHNLMPVGHLRDDDPPHAKIASDVIACIVLVSFPMQAAAENYGNKAVMQLFLPVAVQFLHKGNREISRHMARYLSLAAVHHAELLKPHVHTIMDSIMSGNYPLCRILTNLYEVCPEPLEGHVTALVSLLPHAEQIEKNSLFSLLEQIAVRRPEALKAGVPQLISYLCPNTTGPGDPGCMCEDVLQLIASVSRSRVSLTVEHASPLTRAATHAHLSPRARAHALAALTQISLTDHARAQSTLQLIVDQLWSLPASQHAAWLRAAAALCRAYPQLFTDKLLAALRPHAPARPKPVSSSEVNRTSGGVTIVKLSGSGTTTTPTTTSTTTAPGGQTTSTGGQSSATAGQTTGYTRRAKLGDSRSTGRLHAHRSMTRLNVPGGSVGGLHKSMTRLSSSQQINAQQNNASPVSKLSGAGAAGGVTVTTVSRLPRHHHNILISNNASPTIITSPTPNHHGLPLNPCRSTDLLSLPPLPSLTNSQLSNAGLSQLSQLPDGPTTSTNVINPSTVVNQPNVMNPSNVTVTSRRNNTSVTMINSSNNNNSTSNHRISVFEPYPMKDTVQHFCEKHLDKIKAYMDTVSLRIPPPAKCTIEERRSKKLARLQFACGRRGPHCLYAKCAFSLRTRHPRAWIHLMFLALQARQTSALSSRDASVTSLKMCWDALKCENRTFLTLVTSAFPAQKEQEFIINELRLAGFFDVFEINAVVNGQRLPPTQCVWGCFLCNHPERAVGFLAGDGPPVIEGQLKEKKGRWRLFRRWRTRYFTLSGAHLSCKGSSGGESIDINQIRSVKVSRGARNIPKAFEIFTGDQTLILKPKDGKNAEEWVQCLSIAVAHSQARDVPAKANSLPARGLTLKSF